MYRLGPEATGGLRAVPRHPEGSHKEGIRLPADLDHFWREGAEGWGTHRAERTTRGEVGGRAKSGQLTPGAEAQVRVPEPGQRLWAVPPKEGRGTCYGSRHFRWHGLGCTMILDRGTGRDVRRAVAGLSHQSHWVR